MTDQVYLQKINGNPGFVDGATIPPFASKAALDASGSGWEIGTIANAAGVPYSWRGAGVGWVEAGGTESTLSTLLKASSKPISLAMDAEKYSDPTAWTTGEVIRAPAVRSNSGNIYISRSNGTCGAAAPTHTNTTNTTDGGVLWLYMGSVPTYSVDTTHGPTVSDGASSDGTLTNIYYPATTGANRITVRGGSLVTTATTSVFPRVYQTKPDNTAPVGSGVTVSFYTDSTIFEIKGVGAFNVEVDGKLAGFGTYTSASSHYLKFNFTAAGAPKRRKVTIHGNKDIYTLEAIRILPSAQIWQILGAPPARIAWVSDSICAGSEPGPHCAGNVLPYRVGQDLGGVDVWNFSAAGTGYIAQNGQDYWTFEGRLPQVVASNPDAIVVMGSINDTVPGPIAAAVTSFILAARAQGFCGPIFGIGVIPKNNAGVAGRESNIADGFVNSGDDNAWFIPMYGDPTGPWITGAWNNTANPQSVNATGYIEANGTGTHPVDIGTAYLAGRCSSALREKISALLSV